jgi:hypothetical protein
MAEKSKSKKSKANKEASKQSSKQLSRESKSYDRSSSNTQPSEELKTSSTKKRKQIEHLEGEDQINCH